MPQEWERNLRLREAMAAQGVTFAELAAETGKNLKTAQRWVYEGRVPRLATRDKIAALVGADPVRLWPGLEPTAWTPDLVRLYSSVNDVPQRVWLRYASNACERLDATMCDALLPSEPLREILIERSWAGVTVRVGTSQQIPILRCDRDMLVWLRCTLPGLEHIGPVLHLTRSASGGVFDAYADVFDLSGRRAG